MKFYSYFLDVNKILGINVEQMDVKFDKNNIHFNINF